MVAETINFDIADPLYDESDDNREHELSDLLDAALAANPDERRASAAKIGVFTAQGGRSWKSLLQERQNFLKRYYLLQRASG